jgi:hypothetical protein
LHSLATWLPNAALQPEEGEEIECRYSLIQSRANGKSKKSPFDFSAKKKEYYTVHLLQGQQIKIVGTQCFNADIHLFGSKHDGKVPYESGIFKDNLSPALKIFTIERFYGKSWFKSVGPELGRAAEYSKATWVFNKSVSSQNHETDIKKGQPPLRYLNIKKSTLIIHFSMLNKVGVIQNSWILTSNEKCIEVGLVVLNL